MTRIQHMRSDWPHWGERLPRPHGSAPAFTEGGVRCQGVCKYSKPGAPLVSFVTVVRNAHSTLGRTIQSVGQQTHPNVEHIVLDGASTDGTLDVIQAHAAQLDYFASRPDRGLYDALNDAIGLARGDLICVLNADDWLTADAAATAASLFEQHGPGPVVLMTSAWISAPGQKDRLWQPNHVDLGSYLTCANACHNAMYASREAYERSGPYATHYAIAADFRWLMQCVDAGVPFVRSTHVTTHYSLGGLSSDTRAHSQECVRIVMERFPCLCLDEAWGLYHCLHTFKDRLSAFPESAPTHKGEFLLALARRHSQQFDLLSAIALASLEISKHPHDQLPPGKISRKQKWLRSLRKRFPDLAAAFEK